MNDKVENAAVEDDFESSTISVTHKGRTRKFAVQEISHGLLDKLTAPLTHQDAAKRATAVEKYATNLIAASVSENGTKLTFDEAFGLPSSIAKRLIKEINKVNGADAEAEAEAAKNE